MSRHSKILFLGSEPPSLEAAGAILFHRLFSLFPSNQIKVVTQSMPANQSGRLDCDYSAFRLPLERLNRTRFWRWRTIIRVLGGSGIVPLNTIADAVGSFKCDVVVTLMQDSWSYDMAARYAAKLKKPLIGFVHDLASGFEPVPSVFRSFQRRADKEFLNQCAKVVSVSPGMQRYFSREFNVDSEVMLPPRSADFEKPRIDLCQRLKQSGKLTIGYAGGLHYGYGEQLQQMIPCLRATGSFVEAFGAVPGGSLQSLNEAQDCFRFHGRRLPEEAWREIQSRCDAVLLPYLNPPGQHKVQYQTHFPSKLGDMLRLGLPIIAVGHREASGIRWLSNHPDACCLVTEEPHQHLEDAFCTLRDDAGMREALATRAYKLGSEFDVQIARDALSAIIDDVMLTAK